MQIVRNLAGYTLGRSDLVRCAMSKKKAAGYGKGAPELSYMEMKQEGVPGRVLQRNLMRKRPIRSMMI